MPMLISDHSVGSGISIVIISDKNKTEYATEIIRDAIKQCVIVCRPIYHDKQLVSFEGVNCDVTIKGTDGRKYVYTTSSFKNIILPDKSTALIIASPMDVKCKNFREAYRYPCYQNAIVRLKDNGDTLEGAIKNISYVGVGFILKTKPSRKPEVGDGASVAFQRDGRTIRISYVIRRVEIENDIMSPIMIGASFKECAKDLQRLITELSLIETRMLGEQKNNGK